MPKIRWFDRSFELTFDADLSPCVIERLRGLAPRLESRLQGISKAQLTARPGGAWSIQENVGHLIDLEPLWFGRVEDIANGVDILRPADLENRKTHAADHNAAALSSLLAELREQRQKLVGHLDGLESAELARFAKHPRLDQPMRLIDLMVFVAEHDDHHLARITELLRSGS